MSSVMEYDGYHAKVEFDAKDNIFVGTVIGMNDTIAFHGRSVDELKESFKNCIVEYIDMCEEVGKQPEREFKGVFNIRIVPETHKRVAIEALKDGISLNQFVADAIDEKLERRKEMMV